MSLPITVLVQTKNEELALPKCLSELNGFGEVVVVDSVSTDRTCEIAKSFGARVVEFQWNHGYPKKKQWQLDNVECKYDWVLFLDADERPSQDLVNELERLLSDRAFNCEAYDIELEYTFAGKSLKYGHRVVKRCLLNRHRAEFPVVDDLGIPGMGELEGHYQPIVDGAIGRLQGRLIHDDVDPVRTWFDRHNKYSDWGAHLRLRRNLGRAVGRLKSRQGQVFEMLPLKPIVFFVYSYLLRQGFRDGRPGFDYAIALATYYWQIGLKYRELCRNELLAPGDGIGG